MITFFVLIFLISANTVAESKLGDVGFHPGPTLIDETTRWSKCLPVNQTVYDFDVETLDGENENLKKYKGDVLLIINVATFCGNFSKNIYDEILYILI